VIWAILVLLGVPLWLCASAILLLVFRNRGLRKRAADIPMRLRLDAKGRWHRGHARERDRVPPLPQLATKAGCGGRAGALLTAPRNNVIGGR
jgi:hypothetical protein